MRLTATTSGGLVVARRSGGRPVEAKDGMDATRRSQTAGLDWLHPAQARAAATTLKRRRRCEREVGERAGRERERDRERERESLVGLGKGRGALLLGLGHMDDLHARRPAWAQHTAVRGHTRPTASHGAPLGSAHDRQADGDSTARPWVHHEVSPASVHRHSRASTRGRTGGRACKLWSAATATPGACFISFAQIRKCKTP
jgi:hypothetical protein